MSRLGKLPVILGSKVKAEFKNQLLTLKGPKGELSYLVPESIKLAISPEEIQVEVDFENSEMKMQGGTARSLIKNMVTGVTDGFKKQLELVGVGYRAQAQGQKLTLSLGYSHPVEYMLPAQVKGEVEANTKITLSSPDKQALGQVCAEIRSRRPPEPYKGKGILFAGEKIRRKAGKAGKGSK
ncbi:MAG: 50S ribosomal protein L6 [Candidatus Lambdaproteobacteria bacterium RIFOXYD12_FULL_49_8]|uniref:Large ribosomal subunit protein uL6 n=1 Tax=Candidatus Lambdaproteobacteria bacterium RIFOXYD2_FULL_50_16 TaxID=1817772 RepID=A0A1F6G6G0_9PROT|nr:MAG: 50S ribosomal protein L6 [Candidatus Lambdaproteobacteria bacterium RIFOXYD2_FULL_50_16]OGG96403.1 MAG: 50S ribosomal protein L6 [Candidatus Lambdaproteobacteria bacterium RIFOXYD12_FULL_49_8]